MSGDDVICKMNIITPLSLFLLFYSIPINGDGGDPQSWCYLAPKCSQDNPDSPWNDAACVGQSQSPINLLPSQSIEERIASIDISGTKNYNFKKFKLTNTGKSILIDEFTSETGKPPYFILEGRNDRMKKYNLLQVHFHWGEDNNSGSEHTISGKSYPFEMHLVHLRSDMIDIHQALESGKPDALSVIGILFKVVPNTEMEGFYGLEFITNHLKNISKSGASTKVKLKEGRLSFGDILNDIAAAHSKKDDPIYYMGSLTTPPCQEVVAWIVGTIILEISEKNINAFRHAITEVNGVPLSKNYRNLQEKGDRKLYRVDFSR